MATKKATYKYDNGTGWDEIMFKTTADQVVESTSKRFVSDSEKSNWNDARTKALDWNSFKTNGGEIGGRISNEVFLTLLSNSQQYGMYNRGGHLSFPRYNDQGDFVDIPLEVEPTGDVVAKGKFFSSQFRRRVETPTLESGYSTGFGIQSANDEERVILGIGKPNNQIPSIFPIVDAQYELGASNLRFKEIWLGDSYRGANGYTRLTNGIIMQWGISSTSTNTGTPAFTAFPIAFPNACLQVNATIEDFNPHYCSIRAIYENGFNHVGSFNDILIRWIAIGY